MNVVIDEAEEVYAKDSKPRRSIGECYLLLHFRFLIGRAL